MASTAVKVKMNRELIAWARTAAGYSEGEMAQLCGLSEERFKAWEQGTDAPTIRELEGFALKVKRPLAAFFLPSPPAEPAKPEDFRVLPGTDRGVFSPEILLAFRMAEELQESADELLQSAGAHRGLQLPQISLEDSPELVASGLREEMGESTRDAVRHQKMTDALDYWRDALFEHGVLSVQLPFPVEHARGFSMIGAGVAVIALNTKDAAEARMFSMMHELAHLCLRRPGVSGGDVSRPTRGQSPSYAVEAFCDQFAGAFLLPSEDGYVREVLSEIMLGGSLDLWKVRKAVTKFHVSKYVVLRRLLSLDYIDEDQYWPVFKRWQQEDSSRPRRSGGFVHHVEKIVNQRGKPFVSLVFENLDRRLISSYQATEYLGLDTKWFDRARSDLFRGAVVE